MKATIYKLESQLCMRKVFALMTKYQKENQKNMLTKIKNEILKIKTRFT